MIDRVPHRPEFGSRHKFALHQATGGLLVKGEAGFQCRAVFGRNLGQNLFADIIIELFDDLNGVIGLKVLNRCRELCGLQLVGNDFARIGFELGEHFAGQDIGREINQFA